MKRWLQSLWWLLTDRCPKCGARLFPELIDPMWEPRDFADWYLPCPTKGCDYWRDR